MLGKSSRTATLYWAPFTTAMPMRGPPSGSASIATPSSPPLAMRRIAGGFAAVGPHPKSCHAHLGFLQVATRTARHLGTASFAVRGARFGLNSRSRLYTGVRRSEVSQTSQMAQFWPHGGCQFTSRACIGPVRVPYLEIVLYSATAEVPCNFSLNPNRQWVGWWPVKAYSGWGERTQHQ